jgi:hypothetical protein
VLLETGVRESTSPSADPELATVIVPSEPPPVLVMVIIESAAVIAPDRTVVIFVIVQAKGDTKYKFCAVEMSV